MKIFEWLTSFIAWLQIVASPLIIGVIIGFVVYVKYPTRTRLVIGTLIATLGLIVGIIFATRIWRKHGTVNFMSRVSASPELNNVDNEEK